MVLRDDSVISRATELMEAELGDEMVALDVEQGLCFGLNAPATSVWRLLERPRHVSELKTSLLAEYDVTEAELSEDLETLLQDMVSRGLVTLR